MVLLGLASYASAKTIWRAFDEAGIEFFSTITDYPEGVVMGDFAYERGFTDRSEGVSLRLSRRHADE